MIKNHISTGIFFAVLLMTFNISYSQFNHTITLTGNRSDFSETEKKVGDANFVYYVTSAEDYLFFAAFNEGRVLEKRITLPFILTRTHNQS